MNDQEFESINYPIKYRHIEKTASHPYQLRLSVSDGSDGLES